MIAAVLFDLDGTLLDHERAAAEAITRSFPDADPAWLTARWRELSEEAAHHVPGRAPRPARRRLAARGPADGAVSPRRRPSRPGPVTKSGAPPGSPG
ncbi:hypothetical protein [Actinomadura livida]|uniref:Beta-phosphoglucomutase-like phosphatase (HAD superfamily) n=1 Tax=Actinomadura livida TaxID=79909 RepID=A0A7W7MWM1_9ACTN|nr:MULTISPECIES: hypothetical protein [Actinomadura]MBB4773798.1 beta-phosphoglucomutase-like phosphatase (HAD superfamily) [Actinomadura catellatispora]